MIDWLYDWWDGRTFGAARSPEWSAIQKAFVKEHPLCDYGKHKPTLLNPLNVHHVELFSNNPARELDVTNLQSVCRFHHLYHCHFGNWKECNPHTREDAALFTDDVVNHKKI